MLKKNGYQESINSEIFKRIINTQEKEIRMSINLPNTLRTHKIRFTFYTLNTLCKLPCKPNEQMATEDKNCIVYETDWSNCEVDYFPESKCSLKLI